MEVDPMGQNREVDPSAGSNYFVYLAPLFRASRQGDAEIVRLLLTDPRVNPSENGNQALLNAINSGSLETVRVLMEYGNLIF
jgi:hypothetical protein